MTTPTARPVPQSIAGVLGELELRSPETVTRSLVSELICSPPDGRTTDRIIDTLRRCGWLLPLHTRGIWEFAPAARSGAFSSGDPFLELRAHLERHHRTIAAVAMESAAFTHALSEHPPARDVLAVHPDTRREGALSCYRLVPLDLGPLAVTEVNETPIHTIEALLVSMAVRPAGYKDWPNVMTWLNQAFTLVAETGIDDDAAAESPTLAPKSRDTTAVTDAADPPACGFAACRELLRDRPIAAWARFAYLLRRAGFTDTATEFLEAAPGSLNGPIYLGPRTPHAHYDSTTHVMDSLLGAQ